MPRKPFLVAGSSHIPVPPGKEVLCIKWGDTRVRILGGFILRYVAYIRRLFLELGKMCGFGMFHYNTDSIDCFCWRVYGRVE
jgi:hypothetical protein